MVSAKTHLAFVASCAILVGLVPGRLSAQSAIAGVVKDTSGAVLPGETIEASSPALIKKPRSVITAGSGQSRIVALRRGVYTVPFTRPGFTTFTRQEVELPAPFTANID